MLLGHWEGDAECSMMKVFIGMTSQGNTLKTRGLALVAQEEYTKDSESTIT